MPTVSNTDQNISITCSKNETILEAFDSRGHTLPHGCLSGNCTACLIEITDGKQNLSRVDEIERLTIEKFLEKFPQFNKKTLRLACRVNPLDNICFCPLKRN